MELNNNIRSIEGPPRPADIFEPHMPGVELLSDMDALFELARTELSSGKVPLEEGVKDQRAVALITPGRLIMYQPCPAPGSMSHTTIATITRLLPLEPPQKISVIAYTLLEAFMEDETKTKCIPFLGILIGLGYLGHSVVIFEGHQSALESGVRNCDALLVDSGMLPFLQQDWAQVAKKVMQPAAKLFVFNRADLTLAPVVPSKAKGWQYSEHDGEASYVNCLLTTLADSTSPSALVTQDQALPNLADLTTGSEQLDWISGLPFKYDQLNADEVIQIVLQTARWQPSWFSKTGVLNARLVTVHGSRRVSFTLKITKNAAGKRQLLIER